MDITGLPTSACAFCNRTIYFGLPSDHGIHSRPMIERWRHVTNESEDCRPTQAQPRDDVVKDPNGKLAKVIQKKREELLEFYSEEMVDSILPTDVYKIET